MMNKRGVAMYLVLGVLLVVVILTNVVLSLISSQSKLTNHQVRRVQAYYAAQAGINYALEQLRLGNASWTPTTASSITQYLCRSTASPPCPSGSPAVVDPSLPNSINSVTILLGPKNAVTNTTPVSASANYTFN